MKNFGIIARAEPGEIRVAKLLHVVVYFLSMLMS